MSTLRQIGQQIIRLESGGDPSNDSNLREGHVIKLARQVANRVVRAKEFEKLAGDDRSGLKLIMASYEVDVQGDNPNKYADLPCAPMDFLFDKGLVVAPIDDPSDHFIPRHQPAVSRNLPCADLDPGQVSYWRKGLRVYFDGDELELAKVLIDIAVVGPDDLDIDAQLPIYPEQEYEIIQLTREILRTQPAQDRVLDGADNTHGNIQLRQTLTGR